jgi:hypothetical protein
MTANYLLLETAEPNLVPNPSFESPLTAGWWVSDESPTRSSGVPDTPSGSWCLKVVAVFDDYLSLSSRQGLGGMVVQGGRTYTLSFLSRAGTATRTMLVDLLWWDVNGDLLGGTESQKVETNDSSWSRGLLTATAPENACFASIQIEMYANPDEPNMPPLPSGDAIYFDNFRFAVSPSWALLPTGQQDDGLLVARDPDYVTDDSTNTIGTQIYDQGAPVCERLAHYLQDVQEDTLAWPPQAGYAVHLIPGPAQPIPVEEYYNRDWFYKKGYYKITGNPAPVGTGTLRHLISGDEGANRKVATILDLLRATTTAQRTTIANTYAASSDASYFSTAHEFATHRVGNFAAVSSAVKRQYLTRYPLNCWLGLHAVGIGFMSDKQPGAAPSSNLGWAVYYAMRAITALEAGLVASTNADYQMLTEPLDAVLAMPTGY